MIKKTLFIFLFCLASCGIKTYKLKNGYTKVPIDPIKHLKIEKFDLELNKIIDTNYIYEQFDSNYKILARLDKHIETSLYSVLKFYPDGRFNQFYLSREKNQLLKKENFDPSYYGYRGYYNKKEDQIYFDLFAPVTQEREIGKLTGNLNVQGDTIYMITNNHKEAEIFIKRKISSELLGFKAEW